MALGSSEYLKELHSRHRDWFSEKRKARFALMKGADWGDLRTVRDLRVASVGVGVVSVFGISCCSGLGNKQGCLPDQLKKLCPVTSRVGGVDPLNDASQLIPRE
jgi:hypothetical protein